MRDSYVLSKQAKLLVLYHLMSHISYSIKNAVKVGNNNVYEVDVTRIKFHMRSRLRCLLMRPT